MRTIAIKVDDATHEQLLIVAQLEGVTLTEVIRVAVESHLATLRSGDGLAAKAKGFLEEIDQEAAARKQAVQSLLNQLGGSPPANGAKRSRRPAPDNA